MSTSPLNWRKDFLIYDLRHEMRNEKGDILKFNGTHPYILMQGLANRNLATMAEIIGRNFNELMQASLYYDGRIDMYRQGIGFRTIEDADKFINEIIEPGILAVQMAKYGRVHNA